MASGEINLEVMRQAWRAVARYSLMRNEARLDSRTPSVRKVLHRGLTYDEALAQSEHAEILLRAEPGHRPDVMCRAIICIELERPEETYAAYRAARLAGAATVDLTPG